VTDLAAFAWQRNAAPAARGIQAVAGMAQLGDFYELVTLFNGFR
jgi:hypothetical protein